MAYSHRDLRVHRELGELTGTLLAALVGLIGAILLLPVQDLGALLVIGVAALGGFAMLRGEALVREYERDLHLVYAGPEPVPGRLAAEILSSVPIDRPGPVPSARSPNVRGTPRREASDAGGSPRVFGSSHAGR